MLSGSTTAPEEKHAARWCAVLIIVACMAVYFCNGRPHASVDCVPATYTAWSILRHGSLDLRPYPEMDYYRDRGLVKRADGAWVTMRPLGSVFAAMPFIAPVALSRAQPPSGNTMLQLGKLAGAFSVACAAALFFLVCRRIAPRAAWAATLLFAFGTCLFSVASQALWMHGPATFWLCAALWFLTRKEEWKYDTALAGLALGLAVITRPTTAFFAAATWFALLLQRRWRALAGLTLGGFVPLVFFCWLNWVQFGSLIEGGYAQDQGQWTSSPPFWLGFFGLLIAPSRGVFVYSPALLLLPWGISRLCHRPDAEGIRGEWRTLLIAWLLASAATLLFYAHWWDWSGDWCYGPRFLCETMPALCLTVGLGYEKLRSRWGRGIALGLIALSVLVHAAGVFGYNGDDAWHVRHTRNDQGLCLFELHDTQIGQHLSSMVDALFGKNGAKR